MFFRRKGKLRREFDEKLLDQLSRFKTEWNNQSSLIEKSLEPSEDVICDEKLTRAKYLFLFKEAKERNISIKGK